MKTFLIIALSFVSGLLMYHTVLLSYTLDERAADLGWLQYSAKYDQMVAKEEFFWELHYLKTGLMK